MAYTQNSRSFGYDNIAAGSVKGVELGQLNAETTVNENNGVGNAQAINVERGVGTTGIPASASGTEIP